MNELRERFLGIIEEHVKREGKDELIKWLESSDFFQAPASTRFHGNYDGGLVEHSLNVYGVLKDLVSRESPGEFSDETIAIVALLHDLCKVNFYKRGTRNVKQDGRWVTVETWEVEEKAPLGDHADKSIIIIQQFMKLSIDEIMAIRAHMGAWDNANQGGSRVISNIFDRSKLAVMLHMADMAATYLIEGKKEANG